MQEQKIGIERFVFKSLINNINQIWFEFKHVTYVSLSGFGKRRIRSRTCSPGWIPFFACIFIYRLSSISEYPRCNNRIYWSVNIIDWSKLHVLHKITSSVIKTTQKGKNDRKRNATCLLTSTSLVANILGISVKMGVKECKCWWVRLFDLIQFLEVGHWSNQLDLRSSWIALNMMFSNPTFSVYMNWMRQPSRKKIITRVCEL